MGAENKLARKESNLERERTEDLIRAKDTLRLRWCRKHGRRQEIGLEEDQENQQITRDESWHIGSMARARFNSSHHKTNVENR